MNIEVLERLYDSGDVVIARVLGTLYVTSDEVGVSSMRCKNH